MIEEKALGFEVKAYGICKDCDQFELDVSNYDGHWYAHCNYEWTCENYLKNNQGENDERVQMGIRSEEV